MNKIISIAKDYSKYPAGRFELDGPYSGEAFRRKFLEPAIRNHERVIIDLDGTRGYGSSFLEEAFGGLVRSGISAEEIKDLISFKTSDKSLEEEILSYIEHQVESN